MAIKTKIPTLLAVTGVTGALFAGTAASAGSAAPAPRVAADRTVTIDATTMSADAMLAAMPDARLDPPQARIRVAIANLAKSQIGKREVPSQCGGRANCYPKAYKTNKYVVRPDEWCGVFVNWAWTKGGADKRPSMKGSGLKQGHYATYWQKWGKSVKRWRTQADIGDAIVYGSYPSSAHIGVVVGVKYSKTTGKITYVRTVEGNVGDKVTDKGWRKVGSLYGRGFKASGYVAPVPGA